MLFSLIPTFTLLGKPNRNLSLRNQVDHRVLEGLAPEA